MNIKFQRDLTRLYYITDLIKANFLRLPNAGIIQEVLLLSSCCCCFFFSFFTFLVCFHFSSAKVTFSDIFFFRILVERGSEMKEGAEGMVRGVEGGEEKGASQTLSRPHQSFPWEWVLLKSRELVRFYCT